MSTGTTKHHTARIIGGLMIVGSAALAVGLRAANDVDRNSTEPPNPSIVNSAKGEFPRSPQLQSVPPQCYPLTLANEPATGRGGVITADHYESADIASATGRAK